MAYIKICDLCGKEIYDGMDSRKFCIREHKLCGWVNIDVHTSCVDMLFGRCKEEVPPAGGSSQQNS